MSFKNTGFVFNLPCCLKQLLLVTSKNNGTMGKDILLNVHTLKGNENLKSTYIFRKRIIFSNSLALEAKRIKYNSLKKNKDKKVKRK